MQRDFERIRQSSLRVRRGQNTGCSGDAHVKPRVIEGQNARDAAKNKGEQYQGHPQGKRPDALLPLLLWRVAQLITETAPEPVKQVLLNLRAVGIAAKTSTDMRATRCFVVPADDNHVKRIWAAESRPELRELGRV